MKNTFSDYQQLLEKEGDKEQKRKDYFQILDKYYDDNIIQIENSGEPIKGKDKLIALEHKNFDRVDGVKSQIKDVVIDEESGIVWGQMIINLNSKKIGNKRIEEAFIQKWSNGKIYYQRFFYGKFIDVK